MSTNDVRHNRKVELAGALRLFGELGYETGRWGHATVRDPGPEERYWINPLGIPFGEMRAKDLLLLDADAVPVDPAKKDVLFRGFRGQQEIHQARADAVAVLHVHSPSAVTWSSVPEFFTPFTVESASLYGLQAITDDDGTGTHSPRGTRTAAIGKQAKLLIQRGHGVVTWGGSVGEAAFLTILAERAATSELIARAAGRVRPLEDHVVESWPISPSAAETHFKAHFAGILAKFPEIEDDE
ncbi:class II aldolase/adducin family protein [Paenarthrobacter sp. NPDC089675]|uniref:class II aldolase/adducin family protein n=1 Tax=Paenarthrobacter sp. NPDC089675 TaxID=3364376 RepID=UPI00381991C6